MFLADGKIFIVVTIFILLSCEQKNGSDRFHQGIHKVDENLDLRKYKVCIILPTDGCPNCIAVVKRFLNRHKIDSMLVLATRVRSKKTFFNNFNREMASNKNFLVDWGNRFNMIEYDSDYPWLLTISGNGIITEVSLDNPSDTTWMQSIINTKLKK